MNFHADVKTTKLSSTWESQTEEGQYEEQELIDAKHIVDMLLFNGPIRFFDHGALAKRG